MNILNATTIFMDKAGQLKDHPNFNWQSVSHRDLRANLLREEFNEYLEAELNDDLVEVVDGLLDIIVIAWGTLLSYVGEEKATRAAEEVFNSNLKKVVGEGLPIFREDGKVLKPEGWTPPDIAKAIS